VDKTEWIPYGPCGWLLRAENLRTWQPYLHTLTDRLEAAPPPHFKEAVFGVQSLLLLFSQRVPQRTVETWLGKPAKASAPGKVSRRSISLPVVYEGEDLEFLAQTKKCSVNEIIERHCRESYTVLCMGFAPGFGYLGPLDAFLQTPRRATPRERIRAGSVAIGGPYTAVYPVESPGGWHCIGHTSAVLFDSRLLTQHPPDPGKLFMLRPGDKVKFCPVEP